MAHTKEGISYSPTGNKDSGDRAKEAGGWNTEHTCYQASEKGMEISDEQLDVIGFLRDYYVEHGWPKRTHELSRILDRRYKHMGGKKYLHKLFPGGPLSQGPALGGLPPLANVVDLSFGTSH